MKPRLSRIYPPGWPGLFLLEHGMPSEPSEPVPSATAPSGPQPEPRCGTCTHWGGRVPAWNTLVHRTCNAPAVLYGSRLREALQQADSAVIETYEGWGVLTGPDFGCVHWQAGPQQPSPYVQLISTMPPTALAAPTVTVSPAGVATVTMAPPRPTPEEMSRHA